MTVLWYGALALVGMGLASGTAQANHHCTNSGVCNNQWCPGQPLSISAHKGDHLSPSEINWDMNVCHWSFFGLGNHYGGVPVGAYGLKEGRARCAMGVLAAGSRARHGVPG
jgi:hypothetical protein